MSQSSHNVKAALADCIETPCLRQLYVYWEQRRGERSFPARRDLDPLDFRSALGHIALIDVVYDPLRFRFRLHGTDLVRRAGYDMTGKMVEELPNSTNRATLIERCRALVETRQPMRIADKRPLGTRLYGYEAVWLPLGENGLTVTMLMGGLVYRDSRAAEPFNTQPGTAA
ncbi:MAG TPA: PAS domain-containing protein [Stellaceae bacterium]|nr:PAS domain-containing protein [Stellaceae bacterium]